MARFLLLRGMAEADPVIDKELAPDDKEQDDARQDIREGLVQPEFGGDIPGTLVQEHQQEGGQDHPDRIELGHPRDHDRRETAAAGDRCRKRMVCSAHQQQACQAAQRAGKEHGPDNDFFHLDADIAGCPHALTDDGDLISLLGIVHVDEHEHGQDRDHDDVQQGSDITYKYHDHMWTVSTSKSKKLYSLMSRF